MDKEKSTEENPLYRFFNVILFILYAFVFLLSVLAAVIGYNEHNLISAKVKCRDGTTWDATKIYWDEESLCGICTKRNADGTKYQKCDYLAVDISSYEVIDKQYAWTWKTVIYPLVVIVFGLGFVDFIRLAVVYVFSGRVDLGKSLLLKLIALLFQSQNKNYGQ